MGGPRRLRCPRCSHVTTATPGVPVRCPACGHGAPRTMPDEDWPRLRPDADLRRAQWTLGGLLCLTVAAAAYLLAGFVEPRVVPPALRGSLLFDFQTGWALLLAGVAYAAGLSGLARRAPSMRVWGHMVAWLPLAAFAPLAAEPVLLLVALPWFAGALALSCFVALLRVRLEQHADPPAVAVHAFVGPLAALALSVLPMGMLLADGCTACSGDTTGFGLWVGSIVVLAVAGLGFVSLAHQVRWRHAHVVGGVVGAGLALSGVAQFVLALPAIVAGIALAAVAHYGRPMPEPDVVRWNREARRENAARLDGFSVR